MNITQLNRIEFIKRLEKCNAEIREMSFDADEVESVKNIIWLLKELEKVAKTKGLLAMEDVIFDLPQTSPFAKYSDYILLACDTHDADIIWEHILLELCSSGAKGYEALKLLIVARALGYIAQKNEHDVYSMTDYIRKMLPDFVLEGVEAEYKLNPDPESGDYEENHYPIPFDFGTSRLIIF